MTRTQYGLQMYSLRDITGDDLKGALKQVADMGYKYIEFAGFFGHDGASTRTGTTTSAKSNKDHIRAI